MISKSGEWETKGEGKMSGQTEWFWQQKLKVILKETKNSRNSLLSLYRALISFFPRFIIYWKMQNSSEYGVGKRKTEKEGEKREICYSLAHSPNGHDSQAWARNLKLRFRLPHECKGPNPSVIFHCFLQSISRELRLELVPIWDAIITDNHLTYHATTLETGLHFL